jgi:hypothetical protein
MVERPIKLSLDVPSRFARTREQGVRERPSNCGVKNKPRNSRAAVEAGTSLHGAAAMAGAATTMAGAAATMGGVAATMAGTATTMAGGATATEVLDGRGCFGAFPVKDIKRRQADVEDFLTEKGRQYIRHGAILPSVWHIRVAII